MYEIPVESEEKNNNIYAETKIEEKIAAEPVYNQSLEEMLNKLRNSKLSTSKIEKSVKNIKNILK